MHHWGPRELEIGSIYFLRLEVNPRDHSAVAVLEDRQTSHCKPYLRRYNALIIIQISNTRVLLLNTQIAFIKGRDMCRSAILDFRHMMTMLFQDVVSFIVY